MHGNVWIKIQKKGVGGMVVEGSVDASLGQDAELDLKEIMQVKWDLLYVRADVMHFSEALWKCHNIYHKTWNKTC